MKVGDTLTIKEGKTGKDNILVINKTVFKALSNYLHTVQPDEGAFLFAGGWSGWRLESGRAGDNQPHQAAQNALYLFQLKAGTCH